MAKKFGTVVKEARTAKGLSQTALAAAVDGLSASDVGKIEKNEKKPDEAIIKKMAKPLGLTQKALLEAAGLAKDTAKKTETAKKTSTAKKTDTAKKTSTAKKTGSSSKKTEEEVKLTAAEKKLLEAYRAADKDTKDTALKLLKGEASIGDVLGTILSGKKSSGKKDESNLLASLLGGKTGSTTKKEKEDENAILSLFGGGKNDGNILSLLGGAAGLTRSAGEGGDDAGEDGGILRLIPEDGKE